MVREEVFKEKSIDYLEQASLSKYIMASMY